MFLILGRTASGKDTFARCLEDRGLKGVLSSTTRSKRGDNDNSHRFVSFDVAREEIKNTVASTEINGNLYYTRKEDFEDKDYYIVDVYGAKELVSSLPDIKFDIVYITCDEDIRKSRYMSRGSTTEEDFYARNNSENEQFSSFENSKDSEWWPRTNINSLMTFDNSYANVDEIVSKYLKDIEY